MKTDKITGVALYPSLVLALLFLWTATLAAAADTAAGKRLPVIVIDPGHGGRDTGAKGPGGTLEKEICYQLAVELKALLQSDGTVLITRGGDYDLNPRDRTALANHNKADCFISLHAGAGFLHSATGMTVFSYKPANSKAEPPQNHTAKPEATPRWDTLQLAHMAASRKLAAALRGALENIVKPAPLHVKQAPLRVLQGAAMPAVLIEIGPLTHAETEKALMSADQRKAFAMAIAGGIEAYLNIP